MIGLGQYLAAFRVVRSNSQLCTTKRFLQTIFAVLGLGVMIVARTMGLSESQVYVSDGRQRTVIRGRGLAMLSAGHGILSIAIIVALVTGLVRLAAVDLEERTLLAADWFSLGLITGISAVAAIASPHSSWRKGYRAATVAMAAITLLTVNIAIDLDVWRKLEIFVVAVGLIVLAASYVGRFREAEGTNESETVTLELWMGSLLGSLPLFITVFYHWATAAEFAVSDQIILITVCILMLATGVVWQMKASTVFGDGTLATYLVVLIVSLLYRPQVAIGIYLAAGGGVLFLIGLLLAVFRDRLASLPERIAKREGVFRVIGWR